MNLLEAAAADTLGSRIRQVRKSLQLSQERFAAAIGIAQSSLSQIEGGVILPSLDTLRQVHVVFRIRYDYLLEGREPAHLDAAAPSLLPAPAPGGLPLYDQHALAGGLPANPPQDQPQVHIPGITEGLAIRVAGSSMEPTLHSGDLILCHPVQPTDLRDNHLYVVVTDEGALLKRVLNRSRTDGTLILKSDNREFTTLVLPLAQVRQLLLVRRRITADLAGPETLFERVNALEQALYDLKAQQDQLARRLSG